MIKVHKTWMTLVSTASKPGVKTQRVEATYNFQTKAICICSEYEESVSFKTNTIEEAELKAKAVIAVIKHIKQELE